MATLKSRNRVDVDQETDRAGEGKPLPSLLDQRGEEEGIGPLDKKLESVVVFDLGVAARNSWIEGVGWGEFLEEDRVEFCSDMMDVRLIFPRKDKFGKAGKGRKAKELARLHLLLEKGRKVFFRSMVEDGVSLHRGLDNHIPF